MGGAADLPQRSSSPLKRRAADALDQEMSGEATAEGGATVADSAPAAADVPSIDEQISTVTRIVEEFNRLTPESGTKAWIVSNKWLSRVSSRGSGAKNSDKQENSEEIGPVDNSDIIQETIRDLDGKLFHRLLPGLDSSSIVYLPQEAWKYIVKHYRIAVGQVPIIRTLQNTNAADPDGIPNFQYELYPVVLLIYRLASPVSSVSKILKETCPPAALFIVSRTDNYMSFLKKIKEAAHIDVSRLVRVWCVPRNMERVNPFLTPTSSEPSPPASDAGTPAADSLVPSQDPWRKLVLDTNEFLPLEKGSARTLVDFMFRDQTNNKQYNGGSTISLVGIGADQALVLDPLISGDNYVSNTSEKVGRYATTSSVSQNSSKPRITDADLKTATAARKSPAPGRHSPAPGRNSPAPSGPLTRGRSLKTGRTIGMVGLGNLGNTCYMNSALQCVRSVEELTKYFLSGEAEKEVNTENVLGNNGDVARVYQLLLEEIYRSPAPTSVTPRQFKNTVGRYAPSFSGYGQQDSQEFLGFLLDGLQEDLSRVKKKPYIEKPDSTDEMVGNLEAIREMAAKVWDITKKRDDSVIADLFTGMYKSTLVCPVCDKVSITFDPFNNLTLQLPIDNTWSHDVYHYPLNAEPIRISVDITKHGSVKTLKEFISARVDVPVDRLFVAEQWKSRFFKFFDDSQVPSEEIAANDHVVVYEIESSPTNWPALKKQKKKAKSSYYSSADEDIVPEWSSPLAARMLVPVYQRRPAAAYQDNRNGRRRWEFAPVPHFIVVTPEEARNEDAIRRKILERIATLTTFPAFKDDDTEGSDGVFTTASDADSSGDGKVVAKSVDGEDDVVDIAMKHSDDAPKEDVPAAQGSSRRRNLGQRPKWADPKQFLPPEFQNLFSLGYYRAGNGELVPIGWNSVDEDKEYPTLSSRAPREVSAASDDDEESEESDTEDRTQDLQDGSDEEEELAPTRMNDSSDDEDELALSSTGARNQTSLPVRPLKSGVRVGHVRRRKDGLKTYSNKAPLLRSRHIENASESEPDEGPLIRLGEGIVVDWNTDAFDAIFGGEESDNGSRGRSTYTNIPLMEDQELASKRQNRSNRRKKGLTLDECLDEFGKEEILSEQDTWYCPRCKEHRRASKKFELWKTPDILVMHLKRFSSGGTRRDKLDILVDFPIEGLDLTSRVVENQEGKQEIYDLFAVDDHWGGMGGGHYTAFAKSFVDQEWYEYNDSSVSKQKDTNRIVTSGAYLLFYRRRSSEPLGGPRFKAIIQQYDESLRSEHDDESGEDQRLGADSSLRGSSSALTGAGAGATRPPPGAGSGYSYTMTSLTGAATRLDGNLTDPAQMDSLPAYNDSIGGRDDAIMDDGMGIDEGIDMNETYDFLAPQSANPLLTTSSWNFDNLNRPSAGASYLNTSGAGSNADSDVVEHASSPSDSSLAGRLADFDNAEPDGGEWEEPAPVPDFDEDLIDSSLVREATRQSLQVPQALSSVDEDDAAEIHLDEADNLKLD